MSYDYIIVGGGSAGCALASRLTEDPSLKVLLLEAGGHDRNLLFHLPAGFAKMTKGIASWGWSTVPQKHMNGRVLRFTQAKVIGGGSTINAQIYNRGNALDYDAWAAQGCPGWSFADVLPYYKRAEDNERFANDYHGTGGPLGVSNPISPLPICEAFFRAAQEYGIPYNPDIAGARQDGVGHYQLTQKNARRSSAVTGYLAQARDRPNLTLRLDCFTTRIILEKERAVGVEVAGAQGPETIRADAEVIVSSGAIGTPKLLMLSGIGPADHLKSVGVGPVHDLPGVGSNLQDHLDLFVICECTGDHTYDKYAKPHWSAIAGLQYFLQRKGPVASSLFETGGYWYADKEARSPDIQFHFGLGSGIEAGVLKLNNAGATLNSAFMRPKSRGTVRLQSTDPRAAPLIDPNYLADPYDRAISIKGLRMAREIMRQKALAPYIMAERLPGPALESDEQLLDYAHRNAKTDHHPTSTCAMGSSSDSVVTPELRVRGIDGLRIADASIMPTVISGNTNAACIMIGEKASDLIRGLPPLPRGNLRDPPRPLERELRG